MSLLGFRAPQLFQWPYGSNRAFGIKSITSFDNSIQCLSVDTAEYYHTPSDQEAIAHVGFPALGDVEKIDHDGSADFVMLDISYFHNARQDQFYLAEVLPDENKLFEWESAMYHIGWEEVYIKDDEVTELPNGDHFSK